MDVGSDGGYFIAAPAIAGAAGHATANDKLEGGPILRVRSRREHFMWILSVGLMLLLAPGAPPKKVEPVKPPGLTLLRLVGPNNQVAEALLAGTADKPVVLFRDSEGRKLRIERTGDWDHGFIRRYSYVGSRGGYVEIRDFSLFHRQGLQFDPEIVTVNGKTYAGYIDIGASDVEARRLGKKLYAEYNALPSDFQKVLWNYCVFASNVEGLELDAGPVGILLSENWNNAGLPDYDIQVVKVTDDENAVPNFQRSFSN